MKAGTALRTTSKGRFGVPSYGRRLAAGAEPRQVGEDRRFGREVKNKKGTYL
jgi:hypothetical protein